MIKTVSTDLICPECGNVFTIMRRTSRQKKYYHHKQLYCPICKRKTNHIEMKNYDILIEKIETKNDNQRTEEEQKIYKLLRNRG